MRKTVMLRIAMLWLALGMCPLLQAQPALPPEVAEHGYADLIVVNGKIVSMDDGGYNTNPGNVYEAMAIKGGRIMALGTNQRIRTLGNSSTQVLDVQGLPVIPGIVESHAHLFGNAAVGQQLGVKSPDRV